MEGRSVTSLSPLYPLYIPQKDGRMVMQSASLEEGYSALLIHRFCYCSSCRNYPPLVFDLMLRVHVSIKG
jgi:hypothetical protein